MVAIATRFALSEPDRKVARTLVDRANVSAEAGFYFKGQSGEEASVALPVKVYEALRSILSRLADDEEVLLINQNAELSPEDAAKILKISRPLVYKRMDDGRLPYRAVGSHRRVLMKDVIALKASEDLRQLVARELAQDTEDLDLNYAQPSQNAS